jgi:hypothetical protein
MNKHALSIALVLALDMQPRSLSAADIIAQFYNDGPDQACVEYSYLPTGNRISLQLRPGMGATSRLDVLPPGVYSQVQVYTMQTGLPPVGASWQIFPSNPPRNNSELFTVIFQIRGRDAWATTYYTDGTSANASASLSPTALACPSPK